MSELAMGICKILAKRIHDFDSRDSLGSKCRMRRLHHFNQLLADWRDARAAIRVLDVGGTRNYWNIMDFSTKDHADLRIDLLNINTPSGANDDRFTHLTGDGCDLSRFEDNSYDIVHSNSVIEHVGDWERMKRFAEEVRRVGRGYFVQTPNYWFPIEPHFMAPCIHWLPEPVVLALVRRFEIGHMPRATSIDEGMSYVQHARLLTWKMLRELFPDADIMTEHYLGLPKSYIAIRRDSKAVH